MQERVPKTGFEKSPSFRGISPSGKKILAGSDFWKSPPIAARTDQCDFNHNTLPALTGECGYEITTETGASND